MRVHWRVECNLAAGKFAQKQLKRDEKAEIEESKGSVDFSVGRKSQTTLFLNVENTGKVDVKNVTIKMTPFLDQEMPSIIPQLDKPIPVLRPTEKVLVAYLTFNMGTGDSFQARATWIDPQGNMRDFEKTISNH